MYRYHDCNIRASVWYFLCLLFVLSACATGPSTTSTVSSTPTQPTPAATRIVPVPSPPTVPETCQATPLTPGSANNANSFPEAQGKATNAELWALFFADPQAIHPKQEVKIVWRMTGNGDFHIVARHAGNRQINPVWGPEEHGSSSWNRPGAEWGAGFSFPVSGCWDLHATRDAAAGDVWIMVK